VRNGILVQPEDPEALADGILRLYRDADLRATLANAGLRDVEQFAMQRVARRFLSEVAKIAPAVKIPPAFQDQVRACAASAREQV
jgi:glycosyltransferase involved in cell wall biosynthesis